MTRLAALAVVLSACAGCGDDGGGKITVDIDNGTCAATEVRFTGEIVNWSSNPQGDFCGVLGATLANTNGGEISTAPNGRFDTCIPKGTAVTLVPVTPPATPGGCSTGRTYSTAATMVADPTTIQAGADFSLRLFDDDTRTTFFQQVGAAYDATKGQLLVHVFGDTTRDIAISSAHDAAQAYVGGSATSAWAAGTHGDYVFFPNVALDGTTKITVAGQAIGAGAVSPAAGQITGITVYTR